MKRFQKLQNDFKSEQANLIGVLAHLKRNRKKESDGIQKLIEDVKGFQKQIQEINEKAAETEQWEQKKIAHIEHIPVFREIKVLIFKRN